jgi:hypothetical protein
MKCLRRYKQGSRYLRFLAFSWFTKTLLGDEVRYDTASVSVMRMSKMDVCPWGQRLWVAVDREVVLVQRRLIPVVHWPPYVDEGFRGYSGRGEGLLTEAGPLI